MTEQERTTIYMWLVHEDFRLHNHLNTLYDNFMSRKITNDDLLKLILIQSKIEYFREFKQDLLYLLNLET